MVGVDQRLDQRAALDTRISTAWRWWRCGYTRICPRWLAEHVIFSLIRDQPTTNTNLIPTDLHHQLPISTQDSATLHKRGSSALFTPLPFLPYLPLPPMPLLHPSRCAQRITASLPSRTSASTSPAFRRSISSSRSLRSASGSHEDHYDPPSGWLWGVPPGQKYQKEGWENIWFWGFCGSLGLGVIAYAYKPDTRYV